MTPQEAARMFTKTMQVMERDLRMVAASIEDQHLDLAATEIGHAHREIRRILAHFYEFCGAPCKETGCVNRAIQTRIDKPVADYCSQHARLRADGNPKRDRRVRSIPRPEKSTAGASGA